MTVFDGIVLAGGLGTRMGSDKALTTLQGETFLERTLGALSDARSVVVVGPRKSTTRKVVWTREEPAGSGPAAGIAAAMPYVTSPVVAVLPVDLPGLDRVSVARLVGAMQGDGAALVDDEGSRQLPTGAYRTDALRGALEGAGPLDGLSLRSALGSLELIDVHDPLGIDCDTPEDVALVESRLRARERLGGNA
ncbi:MAG: molybdenum cofactor guanylyltransferase [Actinomycetota bacterium]|nr:molybdenum cofactor guanylyltransferase [Actinomycetota bacterium]